MVSAAVRAAATSGVAVGDGVAPDEATLVPQPASMAMAAAAASQEPTKREL